MINFNLKQILYDQKISQNEFAKMTGIPKATISDLCNNKRKSIQFNHLLTIVKKLNITDFNDLFKVD